MCVVSQQEVLYHSFLIFARAFYAFFEVFEVFSHLLSEEGDFPLLLPTLRRFFILSADAPDSVLLIFSLFRAIMKKKRRNLP